jgi:hypothetical protein
MTHRADWIRHLCFADASDSMQSGCGCNIRGVDPAGLTARQYGGHPVHVRAAQSRATGLQSHLGGESHLANCFEPRSYEERWLARVN